MRGRAALKYELSRRFSKYVNNLPFNGELVEYLKKEKESGRKIVLVTACEENLAKKVVSPLGLFDEIYGSERGLNLKGSAKAEFIQCCNNKSEKESNILYFPSRRIACSWASAKLS